ncbi:MAG: hypothetical protein WCE54_23700 [Ignavibacteriaceae bacterium]
MSKCIVCGREIENTHYLIQSRGVEINFYSKNCISEYVKNIELSLSKSELPAANFENQRIEKPRIYNTLRLEN